MDGLRSGYLWDVVQKLPSGPRLARGLVRFDPDAAQRSARLRGESLTQLIDRNLAELLQELRVAITGVQILFAFLLGLAFTQRFGRLGGFEFAVYTGTLLVTALATILLIAPVSFHRLVFRRGQKQVLVAVGDRLLMVGLGLLVVAISGAVLLILDVVLGRTAGVIGGTVTAVVGLLTWYGLPLWARRTGFGRPDEGDGDGPPRG
jgi:Family of unknown function (DUF6328)